MRLVWHYLARGRTLSSTRSPEQLAALRIDTIQRIDAIRDETRYLPKKSKLCDWCEYKAFCPAWHDDPAPPPARTKPSEGAGVQLSLL
jgi:putative RecB family exonuclease